ncbi:hypothetical protein E2562_019895 [Oryza meyeriana var. granulata]|uniref:Disease resistance protein At4g27190-like leucine-rich repeats domain-containing protein n=1 Tax=Oryza meyeriana var. granulata TaxID=110450 RepID=A0A6G1EXL6_9ORYZ|nr:hypothetical protein E2562_019895 [Oryza meyeriana var. granulata]
MAYISANSVQEAIQQIIPYIERLNYYGCKDIYLAGWNGLGASAVLRAIAEHPPSYMTEKFDKIIHIDCSRWKSRRALQRTIADELKLPKEVMAIFDRQDEDDDFSMVDEGSRAEIAEVTRVIHRSLLQYRCLVLFHNGLNYMIDLYGCGLPPPELSGTTVLWTFQGRLRRYVVETRQAMEDGSHMFIAFGTSDWDFIVREEAKEISLYTQKLGLGVTPEIATECLLYLLTLGCSGANEIVDYNWAIHASNYWVCDGIIVGGGQDNNKAWEVARALHQEIQLEDLSDISWRILGERLDTPPNRWIFATKPYMYMKHPGEGTTSFFLACQSGSKSNQPLPSLPNDMFHQADQLRVLKLCRCSFSFLSPPFHCCHNLRFLGLDSCTDSPQGRGEEEEKDRRALEIFQRLWVLDVCHTDWELDFAQQTEEQMGANTREIHIKKGRIWHNHLAWRRFQNLHKLRVIEPTSSWMTGEMDEFMDMVKLEHLDLSGNSTIQALPCLSRATGLKNLVLDGCVGLEQVCPERLPPSLETFCLDAGSGSKGAAKLVKISLAGCVHLKNFLLRGAFPELEELNLSGTSIRKVDLSDQAVQVQRLEKVFLVGCKQLRAILWWKGPRQLEVLWIDNHERNSSDLGRPPCSDSSSISIQEKNYDGYVIATDARIIQSLRTDLEWPKTWSLYLHLYIPSSTSSSRSKEQSINSSGEAVITKPCRYSDVLLQLPGVAANAYDEITSWPAPSDFHVEIGEGISLTDVESNKGIKAIELLMNCCIQSMHVHDNSRILDVWPISLESCNTRLEWCRVERCTKLKAVFDSYHSQFTYCFDNLETIWASDLLTAGCIWCKGTISNLEYTFEALKSIHLHNCPRLKFVLPLRDFTALRSLETLHITHCADLSHVFPRDDGVPPQGRERTVKEFLKLRHINLHDLPNLQEICEGWSMYAPMLEGIKLRGCWSLRRLPAVGRRHRPVVNCEKECWEKLEWDDHHNSLLYKLHQSSSYYRKRLPRGTLLC